MLKKLLLAITLALGITLATPAMSDVTEIKPGTILFHQSVDFGDFEQLLKATSDTSIDKYLLIFQSPGGKAIECIAMMNHLMEMKRHGVEFETRNYAMAMSAGSYMFLLGDKRVAYEGSMFMWHTVRSQIDDYEWDSFHYTTKWFINQIDNWIRKRFKELTGMSDASVKYWLDGGKAQFMSAETAYNVGIATHYVPSE